MCEHNLEERVKHLENTAIANLRDFFAVGALSILGNDTWVGAKNTVVATKAYEIADAMIAERNKGKQ